MATEGLAVLARGAGGAEVLEAARVEVGPPGAGEVQLRHVSCGVNFIDVYQRTGLYPMEYPAAMGNEAAGVVVAAGGGADGVAEGDTVAYCTHATGAYCSLRNVPAAKVVPLPDGMDPVLAGGVMLRGLTAEYLARRSWPVLAGSDVLVTAAAGGVGTILCQWLARLGAQVVGVVGSEAKVGRAEASGCDHVLVGYDGLGERVREITPKGVSVAYDSVGAATWPGVLDAISPRGCLVSYGNASGPVPALAPLELASRGSLYVHRPTLAHYAPDSKSLLGSAAAFFDEIARGMELPNVTRYPLADAADAHRALEGREVDGVVVLVPEGI